MPLQPQALPAKVETAKIGSTVVFRIEDTEGHPFWTSRSRREAEGWVAAHNVQVVKDFQDQLYIRGHRVLNALAYLSARASRAPTAIQMDLF